MIAVAIAAIKLEVEPNQNVYLARGIADATAERFQQTATGYFDDSDL